ISMTSAATITTNGLTQVLQDLYIAYVERRDTAIKRSLQKNFTKTMHVFPNFPKELHADEEEEEGETEINKLIDDVTKSGDEKEEVPLNALKQKMRYKHAAHKSTRTN
ncbi:hypothetical protein J1N35_011723, partial [Gossypium stocksii]